MIIRSLARRSNGLQCLASAARCRATATPASFARKLHNVPTINNHEEVQANGIKDFLSPKAFDTAYVQYQQHINDELNFATAGSGWDNMETKDLVINFAREPNSAYLFNLASMAFNNHFFFKHINTDPNLTSTPPSDLTVEINKHFSSMDTFRETFLGSAEAMFGPGFVWLVQLNDTNRRELRILNTYLAGSPLSGAHYRRQEQDLNTHNPESYQKLNSVGKFGRAANVAVQPKKPLGGVDITPILCVNTWEHVWLEDYGIRGKREYLEAWWNKINWNEVADLVTITENGSKMGQGHRQFQYA